MQASRTHNAKKNALSGFINKVVLLIIPFIIRTVIIQNLGAEYLGLNSLFLSFLKVLNMAELGFSSAITFNLYLPLAEKNDDLVCAYVTYFKKIYRRIGFVITGCGMILFPFLPHFIKNGADLVNVNIYIVFTIFLLNTAFSYLFWGYKRVLLIALQKSSKLYNIDTAIGLIKSALQLLVLIFISDYYMFCLLMLAATIATNIVVKYTTDKQYPSYANVGYLDNDRKELIVTQVKGVAIGRLSVTARNSFDSIVLSMFSGLTVLAVYSNYYLVVTMVLGFFNVLVIAVSAGIGDSVATETKNKNYNDFKKFYFIFSWIGAWATTTMLCLYQPFMNLWVGKDLVVPDRTMFMFVLYFYILQSGQVRSLYTKAFGLWWEVRRLAVGEMILNLLLNFVLGYYFGMEGILLATIITVTIFSIIGVGKITVNLGFKVSSVKFFIMIGSYAIITLVLCIGMYWAISTIKLQVYMEIIVIGLMCVIVPNLVILGLSMFNENTRSYVLEIKKHILKRKLRDG